MGNAQSASPGHNRLSKPKTNTNSPFATPKVDSSSPISQYAELSMDDRHRLRTQLMSPIETETGSGFTSDGDESLGKLATHVQARLSSLSRSNSIVSPLPNARSSTTKLASLPGSNLSLASSNQPVDLDTAIRILQEVRKNATPEDLAALHEALQPSAPSPSPVPSHGLDRRTSVVNRSSLSLTRRRSLAATPGVATRGSPVEGTRRRWNSWRTPEPQPQEQSKWRVEMMGSSPLTRLAALDLAEDGRESPTPRAKTPGEMDYSHLGSLKLGSLVVTNGAPSPAPSAMLKLQEDYFTASEGGAGPAKMLPQKQRRHTRSKSAVLPPTPPLHRELRTCQIPEVRPVPKIISPLKLQPKTQPSAQEPGETPTKRLHVVNKSADTLAQDYMKDIAMSPYEDHKDSGVEFHDEGVADVASLSFRDEAFRILDGTIFDEKSAAASTSLMSTQPVDTHRQRGRRPTPRKADSGYSSGGSFRAAQRAEEASQDGTVSTLSRKASLLTDQKRWDNSDADDAASLYTFEQMLSLAKPLPELPGDQDVVSTPPTAFHLQEVVCPPPASSALLTPRTVGSTESKSSTQRRLQKRRPSSQNLPVVQACHPVADGSIPDIPTHVRAKFTRRLSESPAMECLTQTYASTDHVNSSDPAMDSPIFAPIEFPSPTSSPAPSPWSQSHGHVEAECAPPPPPHRIRRSLSLFRSKPGPVDHKHSHGDNEESPLNVVDLGTVVGMLGRSPYDAAMPVVDKKKKVVSPTHPHQLGNSLPRAKSMVNMDAKTAAEVARMRSKDRAAPRPEMPQRPRSYHDLNLEAGEAIASRRRPHSIYESAPPVPAIHVGQRGLPHTPAQAHVEPPAPASASFRARATGRGPVVSHLIDMYDGPRHKQPQGEGATWDSHARLWSQRRKSIGEGLRQRAEVPAPARTVKHQASSTDMAVVDRYSGGLAFGYEGRELGIGGSAGTRQLRSAASRKSMHFSNEFGVDLSDVPIFVQRA